MKSRLIFGVTLAGIVAPARAQIPVTDVANLAANQIAHGEDIAKWLENIEQLRTQIAQLDRQIAVEEDLRRWAGDPTQAGKTINLDLLSAHNLGRTFALPTDQWAGSVGNLDSLTNTSGGAYRSLDLRDLDGNGSEPDANAHRRFALLDATKAQAETVSAETKQRVDELQGAIAAGTVELKNAASEAETQKLAAHLNVLSGQVAAIENERRRAIDQVQLQKAANDARREQEQLTAAEAAARDDYLASLRISAYMKTIKLRSDGPK